MLGKITTNEFLTIPHTVVEESIKRSNISIVQCLVARNITIYWIEKLFLYLFTPDWLILPLPSLWLAPHLYCTIVQCTIQALQLLIVPNDSCDGVGLQ